MGKQAVNKTGRKGTVVLSKKTKTGATWEIFFTISKGVKVFGARLITRNGRSISFNGSVNTKQGAIGTMNSVSKNAPL